MWKIIGGIIFGFVGCYLWKDNRDKKRQKSLQDQIDGLQHDKAEKQKEEAELQREIRNAQARLADKDREIAKLLKGQAETDAMILKLEEMQELQYSYSKQREDALRQEKEALKRDIERSEAERKSAEEALAVLNNKNKAIGDTIVGLENELTEKRIAASRLEDVA